jgi:hypothetical protein
MAQGDRMTDDVEKTTQINGGKQEGGVTGKGFKPGYDPRRWLKGRPKKPASLKEAEELVSHVIWEELSRTIKNPETGDEIDSLRLMIRSMIRSKATQDKILDRIAGKVAQTIQGPGENGELITKVVFVDDTGDHKTPETPPDAGGGE